MAINYNDFIHPADKKALKALKAVPGFDLVTKKFMELFIEKMFKIQNTSSYLKLGPNQMPEIYNILVKVCKKLEIEVPELYLALDREPNAATYGDTEIFIVINSGLLETMSLEQIETVIAHECGHIICHHTLYHAMARYILHGAEMFVNGIISNVVLTSLQYAFYYWSRCSELSADRVAAYYHGSADPVIDIMMAFAGGTKNLKYKVDKEEFLNQAEQYKVLIDNSAYNKVLEFIQFGFNSHPLNSYRAYEVNEFFKKYEIKYLGKESNDCRILGNRKDFNLRIRYEYIRPKGVKILVKNNAKNQLETIIDGKTTIINKNDSKDIQLEKNRYDIIFRNGASELNYSINLKYNMNLIVSWNCESQKLEVREEL